MRPRDELRNGVDGGERSRPASASGSEEGSGGEGDGSGGADELSLWDEEAPARVLAALNALRKSRQHFDVLLVADGAEVAAHRAVLAAASPYLLEALQTPATAHRVEHVEAEALRALVEYAYTGRLRVRDAAGARRLYRAAWRLRIEPVRAHLAAALMRTAAPHDCLQLRALPDLPPDHLKRLDEYIASNFEEICSSGAMGGLPVINIEMLRESSAEDGEEAPVAVAEAALAWLRERQPPDVDLEELCSRTHLLYVDARGELQDYEQLRDCGEQRECGEVAGAGAGARGEGAEGRPAPRARPPPQDARAGLGDRVSKGAASDWAVLGAGPAAAGGTRAAVALRGRVVAARVRWRAGAGAGAGPAVARGGVLGGAGGRRAHMARARCALGSAVVDGRLIVCGGYDRAHVLKSVEVYEPASNTWAPLPDMRGPRARFPAARLRGALLVLGGSDGLAELDSVDALEAGGGAWRARKRLPGARVHAAAAGAGPGQGEGEGEGALYVVGGWAAGHHLRRVDRYSPDTDEWTEAPPLITGRSQCASVLWGDTLWALGGCDTWHCLASTEYLRVGAGGGGAWRAGPALPTARRSVGGAVWRGRLVAAGGSDGAASLRRVEYLTPGGAGAWLPGPPLRTPRAGHALAVLQRALYAVGGFDGKQFLACVECLYEPDGEWTALVAPPPLPPSPSPSPSTAPGPSTAAPEPEPEQ